jgi:hypothetical protein
VIRKNTGRPKCGRIYRAVPIRSDRRSRTLRRQCNGFARASATIPATMFESRSCAALRTVLCIVCDILRLISTAVRSRAQLAAENLFLRKQLAMYVERQLKPHRADDATRIVPSRCRG